MQWQRFGSILVAAAVAAAIAACGGSSAAGTTDGGRSAAFTRFAVCMRSHRVRNYPDALSAGPGGGVSPPSSPPGIDTSSPAFKGAWSACSKLLPTLSGHQSPSAQTIKQMLDFSKCMRAHGVTGFPDPSSVRLRPRAGYTTIRRGGVYLAIPATISSAAPAYQHARAACRFGPVFS